MKQIKILLVEDDADTREVIKYQLAEEGYEVLEAAEGQTALKIVKETPPTLILMDISLPGIDGIRVCHLIKSNPDPHLRNIPVIMLTGQSTEVAVKEAAKSGANGYILKPYSIEEVIKRIKKTLN